MVLASLNCLRLDLYMAKVDIKIFNIFGDSEGWQSYLANKTRGLKQYSLGIESICGKIGIFLPLQPIGCKKISILEEQPMHVHFLEQKLKNIYKKS